VKRQIPINDYLNQLKIDDVVLLNYPVELIENPENANLMTALAFKDDNLQEFMKEL